MFVRYRSHSAIWATVPLCLFVYVFITLSTERVDFRYSLVLSEVISHVLILIGFVPPILAMLAAYEGARYREIVFTKTFIRSKFNMVLSAIFPVILLGILSFCVGGVYVMFSSGVMSGNISISLLLTILVIIIVATVFGFTVGLFLPVYISMPLMLFGLYLLITLPAAYSVPWFRHLSGYSLKDCCQIDQVPLLDSVAATLLCYFAVLLICFGVISSFKNKLSGMFLTGSAIISAACGVLIAMPLEFDAVGPRPAQTVCENHLNIDVCLWPEQVEASNLNYFREVASMVKDLNNAGFDLPRYTTASTNDVFESEYLIVNPRWKMDSVEEFRLANSGFFIPTDSVCEVVTEYDLYGLLLLIIQRELGISPDVLQTSFTPEHFDELRRLSELVPDKQAWVNQAYSSLYDCEISPPWLPTDEDEDK